MNFSNPIVDVAAAIHSACHKDLPEMMYEPYSPKHKPGFGPKKYRRPEIYDLREVDLFQQIWGSTALGFGGIGGQAVTTANTVVVIGPGRAAAVYFGGRHAYTILKPNKAFAEDRACHRMTAVSGSKKRYEEPEENDTEG